MAAEVTRFTPAGRESTRPNRGWEVRFEGRGAARALRRLLRAFGTQFGALCTQLHACRNEL